MQNAFFRTTGIVIGKRDFSEADKIMTVVTPEMGKIEIKAKGARKMLAKMNGHLELFNHVDLTLVQGKTWYIVTGAQTIDAFVHIKRDIEWMSFMYYAAELLQGAHIADDEYVEAYQALLELLQCASTVQAVPLALMYFEARMWRMLGLKPELSVCVVCRQTITPERITYSPTKGGVLCAIHATDMTDHAWVIGADTLKAIRLLYTQDWSLISKVRCTDQVMRELRSIFDRSVEYHLPKKLKSRAFMGNMQVGVVV